jgi:hypothetical protein
LIANIVLLGDKTAGDDDIYSYIGFTLLILMSEKTACNNIMIIAGGSRFSLAFLCREMPG